MAEVRAFPGVRYGRRVGDLASVVCAPYDVISPEAQAAAYARSPFNAIRLELGVVGPTDDAASNRYTRAARTLAGWLAEGVLARDPTLSLYVYEERFGDGPSGPGTRRGFFARVRLAEWSERVVLPHERTMPKPRADRLSLLRATRANLSPVFALYEDPDHRIARVLDAAMAGLPSAAFSLSPGLVAAAASEHRLWRVEAPEVVGEVEAALADRQLYIADGHHRYETALEYWRERRAAGADDPSAFLLMHLVDLADPGLVVLPTHRLVRPHALDRRAVLDELRRSFAVEETPSDLPALLGRLAELGTTAHAFGIAGLAPGRLHVVAAPHTPALDALLPADRSPAWKQLDVAILHSFILERLLGLDAEAGAADRLAYTRDPGEALAAVDSGEYPLAVFLNPTRVEQIRDVALAGDRMPEKSTYFWPKPPTGLVFHAHFE